MYMNIKRITIELKRTYFNLLCSLGNLDYKKFSRLLRDRTGSSDFLRKENNFLNS